MQAAYYVKVTETTVRHFSLPDTKPTANVADAFTHVYETPLDEIMLDPRTQGRHQYREIDICVKSVLSNAPPVEARYRDPLLPPDPQSSQLPASEPKQQLNSLAVDLTSMQDAHYREQLLAFVQDKQLKLTVTYNRGDNLSLLRASLDDVLIDGQAAVSGYGSTPDSAIASLAKNINGRHLHQRIAQRDELYPGHKHVHAAPVFEPLELGDYPAGEPRIVSELLEAIEGLRSSYPLSGKHTEESPYGQSTYTLSNGKKVDRHQFAKEAVARALAAGVRRLVELH